MSGQLFSSTNPATHEVLWTGKAATKADVDAAVTNAQKTFESWAADSFETRLNFVLAFREELTKRKAALGETIAKETGKPLWESLTEVGAMIGKIDLSVEAYKQRSGERSQPNSVPFSITRHKPHGVVAVFGPFNFPGHLPGGHIIPALLAGNTIVFKPSELTPLVAEETLRCWEATKLPTGVLNLIQGDAETGKALASHPKLKGLFFTGSVPTGKSLHAQFGGHPEKILALELGGNNPLVVTEIADLKTAAYLTIQSAYLTSGQRCSCARRLIVPTGQKGDAFIETLITMIQKIKVGPYTDTPEPFMGPLISTASAKHCLETQEKFRSQGGEILVAMRLQKEGGSLLSPGLMDVTTIANRPDEELFGPFLQLIRVANFEEAIKEANNTAYGLSAGLLSDKGELYAQFYQKVRAGVVNWNTPLTGASGSSPFGGIGISGNHRPGGFYAVDYCAYPVASMESPQLAMPKAPLPGILL